MLHDLLQQYDLGKRDGEGLLVSEKCLKKAKRGIFA
jgi:hypothetical protein